MARSEFIVKMRDFLDRYGDENTDVQALLDYASKKLDSDFCCNYKKKWSADCKGLKFECKYNDLTADFFDSHYEKGDIEWSITFVGTRGEFHIENEKLSDYRRYDSYRSFGATYDLFYCQNPFGLKGIFEVRYWGRKEFYED